jgi:hypothetical protein
MPHLPSWRQWANCPWVVYFFLEKASNADFDKDYHLQPKLTGKRAFQQQDGMGCPAVFLG